MILGVDIVRALKVGQNFSIADYGMMDLGPASATVEIYMSIEGIRQ